MKIYQGVEEFTKLENAIVTTGTFDGVHIGHRKILQRLNDLAKKVNGESVLLTFYPHPRMVLQESTDLKLLTTIEEKSNLLEEIGIDHLIIQAFTKDFSRTTSLEFVRDILVNQIGTKKLVIGYDHHFGRNREGSFEHLKEFGPLYGFEVEEIPAQEIDDVNVSSTKIRKALSDGEIGIATKYLGHYFKLSGKVIQGDQIGRELGFPTANIEIENTYKLIPSHGVYAVYVKLDGNTYQGMLNIGVRPTINESNQLKIEVHLFDFNQDVYGKDIELQLVKKIRSERKFSNREELIKAMQSDRILCLNIL